MFSPALVDSIYIVDPTDGRTQYVGKLTPDSLPFSGYSFAETKAVLIAKSKLQAKGKEINLAQRIALSEDFEAIAGPAHKTMKGLVKGMQHGSRYRNSTEVRAAEARERRMQGHDLEGEHAVGVAATTAPCPVATTATDDVPESTSDKVVNIKSAKSKTRPATRSAATTQTQPDASSSADARQPTPDVPPATPPKEVASFNPMDAILNFIDQSE
jgi:hypothetical protein